MKTNKPDSLSDETLNSLVDNEFSATERAELLAYLQTDESSKEKLCEISHTKDMVKTAYRDIPQPAQQSKQKFEIRSSYSIVAGIFLTLAIIGFGFLNFNSPLQNSETQRLVMLDPNGRGQQLSQNNSDELRVIFHVSNSTRLNADELLDDIEILMRQSMQNNQKVRIEVVAHAAGLDLLRDRLSTEKVRIASMSKKYPELTFVACMNTVERIEREKGIDVKLVSDAVETRSGVAHVVMRQQQGWIYIQV